MNRLGVSLAGLFVLLGAASADAADIDLMSAEPPPAYDWSGFFIGLNAGDAFAGEQTLRIAPDFQDSVGDLDLNGLFGGAQLGANWQSGVWVLGAQADLQLSDIVDSDKKTVNALDFSTQGKIDWFGSIRLRGGLALDNLLIYGTGGLALAGVDYSLKTVDDPLSTLKLSDDYTATGWTAGGGVEWGFSAKSSAKIEYLYTDLGKKDIGTSLMSDDAYFKASPSFQSIRMGVDFRF